MTVITLSLWDTGGQERFGFFKTDFFKGVAGVALVFDVSRPDTFKSVNEYFDDIRERSGNIPIILVGNKDDLRKDIGETIPRGKIIHMVNRYNLFEYIETSALQNLNVEKLFYRLAMTALMDLKPRIGEIVDSDHFRFKILLLGAAAVGKSTLINVFTNKRFEENYKLTVGLDFMIQNIEIKEEDIPNETLTLMKSATKKKRIRKIWK
ncbi:MAG: ADP-ribosylation factor-like protein [Candidatus Thorarchaeota archaeon]